ncbi:MAG TPA: helix-turn-helix transcriptional regulator [Bacilli bacterium]|nr:helix-turn-helix transcriptional regulator [Bacilli bacterium]
MMENEANLRVGNNLSRIRKSKKLSVSEVAKAIGRSVDTYYSYEEGLRTVPLNVMLDLSVFLCVSIDDIVNNGVTNNRPKAISFDVYTGGEKERVLISSQNDDVVFFRVDRWSLKYYVKCIDWRFDHEVLISDSGDVYPAIVSFDEKLNIYSISNLLLNKTKMMKVTKFKKGVAIIGDYAGIIKKEIEIKDFL